MTNNINGLGFYRIGYNFTRQDEAAAQSAPEHRGKAKENSKNLGANDILNYMAASNTDLIPVKTQKTVDVNNYVSADQADRIADFMKDFEADFDEATSVAVNEFGVDEKLAGQIALAYIDASY